MFRWTLVKFWRLWRRRVPPCDWQDCARPATWAMQYEWRRQYFCNEHSAEVRAQFASHAFWH
jgi:hypothetical protein